MLPWYAYALLSAVFAAAFFIVRKKGLEREQSLPFDSTRFLIQAGILLCLGPFLTFRFPLWLVGVIFLNSFVLIVAVRLMGKSLKHEAISSLAPLQNITPVLVLLLATVFLEETLASNQLFGIGLLIVGAYVLEVDRGFKDVLSPFRKLGRPFVLFFVVAMVLLSVTATVEKFVLNVAASPLELLLYSWVFIAMNLNLIEAVKTGGFSYVRKTLKHTRGLVFVTALLALVAIGLYFYAVSLSFVSLALPVKRLETLISTVVGGELFHEKGLFWKIAACVIMLTGVFFII